MNGNCLNCNKPLPKGVQSSFCSRSCWQAYKERRGMAINPEKQATVMLKEQSRSLIVSLKEELDKKNEVIQHQDKLLKDYRDSLDIREQEIASLRRKIEYYEEMVRELRSSPPVPSAAAPAAPSQAPPQAPPPEPQPVAVTAGVSSRKSDPQYTEYKSRHRMHYTSIRRSTTAWQRFINWWRYG